MNQSEIQALARGLVPWAREVIEAETAKAVEPLLARIAELEARPAPEKGADGKDADPELVKQLVAAEVASLPAPKDGRDGADGKDADPELVKHLVGEAVAAIPQPKDGADGKDADPALIESLVADAVATIPRPKDGVAGKDAEPVTPERILEAILANPGAIQKAVAEYLTANPPLAGKDGRDGVGLSGAVIDHEGALVLTMADGTVHKLGVVKGEKGDRGQDGRGLEGIEPHETERFFGLKFANGETLEWTKSSLVGSYRGIWREGTDYGRGDTVQLRGCQYGALRDTLTKPTESEDWVLLVKAGRDGKDFRPNEPKPPSEPIRFS